MAGVRGTLGRMRKCKRMNQSGYSVMRLSRRQTPPRGDPFPRRDSAF
ncbi:hypothetical protein L810_8560 [Burkholderia sp. AU4i]|nr:hypothetical protein L810_8560 [Burkholderia sp. AU4i]MDW9228138.1 hypothetical protein [Burkholderia cepacia]MDW9242251.1 hypothetical protein [Burkholderia cepacia]QOH33567.1 hypothetical protein C7S14_5247 [Burkholderia cepacia]